MMNAVRSLRWQKVTMASRPILDESKIDIDHSFEFFTNGGGGRVLLDVSNPSENNATIWFTFDPDNIDYGQKFWDVIDDWTFMGLSEDF